MLTLSLSLLAIFYPTLMLVFQTPNHEDIINIGNLGSGVDQQYFDLLKNNFDGSCHGNY